MARRRVHSEINGARTVKVFYDPDLSEYVARLYVAGDLYEPADYFTDDKADAIDTAKNMAQDLPMSEDVTITDPLVRMFGRTRAQIETSISSSRPHSVQRERLIASKARDARAGTAFQSPPRT